jgi:antitoxin VapB
MGLSLKDPETERRIRQLAATKKIGITAAVRLAVDNELARDEAHREAEFERKMAAIREIQARAAKLGPMPSMKEMDDWLYDENGLPH